jgi:hypothetical protein
MTIMYLPKVLLISHHVWESTDPTAGIEIIREN